MTTDSVRNLSHLINSAENYEIAIEKSRAILDILLEANLERQSPYNLYLCLSVLDEILGRSISYKGKLSS